MTSKSAASLWVFTGLLAQALSEHKGTWATEHVGNQRNRRGSRIPSFIHIARLVTPDSTKSIKMVLLK